VEGESKGGREGGASWCCCWCLGDHAKHSLLFPSLPPSLPLACILLFQPCIVRRKPFIGLFRFHQHLCDCCLQGGRNRKLHPLILQHTQPSLPPSLPFYLPFPCILLFQPCIVRREAFIGLLRFHQHLCDCCLQGGRNRKLHPLITAHHSLDQFLRTDQPPNFPSSHTECFPGRG